ncbi:MAG: hypothetical protein Q4C20_08260 [Erysipelotrichaceae bacterium]|nr:hypothetical protein [Erysipelotrichaceae bacterium]
MDQIIEKQARRDLDEQLKRNKPKEVRKLYDMLAKAHGGEDAYTFILNLLSQSYQTLPGGRVRLDSKKYNKEIGDALKNEKKNKVPVLNLKSAKTDRNDLNELLGEAAKEFKKTPLTEFANQFAILMSLSKDYSAAELYIMNRDLFLNEIDQRVRRTVKTPVSWELLDDEENEGFFMSNLLCDIQLAMANYTRKDPVSLPVYEEYLTHILNLPVDWTGNENNINIFKSELYDVYRRKGREDQAEQLFSEWKKENPESFAPEQALLWSFRYEKNEEQTQRALEICHEIFAKKKTYSFEDESLLDSMRFFFRKAGDTEKYDFCTEQIKKLHA